MFLAIINDTYSEVKSQPLARPQINLKEYFIGNFKLLKNYLGGKSPTTTKEKESNETNSKLGNTHYQEKIEIPENGFEKLNYDVEIKKLDGRITKLEHVSTMIIERFDALIDRLNNLKKNK